MTRSPPPAQPRRRPAAPAASRNGKTIGIATAVQARQAADQPSAPAIASKAIRPTLALHHEWPTCLPPPSRLRAMKFSLADAIFEEPRLAEIYDPLDPDRSDLDAYAALAGEFSAGNVLDVGCGTGTLACLPAGLGVEVIAVDPPAAALDVARRKPGTGRVRWLHGAATFPPPLQVDLATMTGNGGPGLPDRPAVGGNAAGSPPGPATGGPAGAGEQGSGEEGVAGVEPGPDLPPCRHPDIGPVETWTDLTEVEGNWSPSG